MKFLKLALVYFTFLTSCNQTKKEAFNLNSFPNDWVRLTEKDGKLVVFNSCDAGNLMLTITKNKKHYDLLIHGEQDDAEYEIIETFKLNDTIFIKAKWKGSNEKQDFKFTWTDKQKKLGRFITIYSNSFISDNIFVTTDMQKNFDKLDQPCRECWGDECDELDKEDFNKNINDTIMKDYEKKNAL
jgi:hypothetical protein